MSDTTTKLPVEEVSEVDEAQAQADFDAGAAMEETKGDQPPRDEATGQFKKPEEKAKPAEKAVDKKEKLADQVAAKPEYVQITKDQLAKFEAALGRTEEFEKQFSKVFGTVGDMQKILRGLQAQTPKGATIKLPPGLFDAMKKDFPELAEHTQKIFEAALQDMEGTGGAGAKIDEEAVTARVEKKVLALAAEDLADEFPDWQKVVGAIDTTKGEKPDPNNLFRKWLATKPQEYQDRINSTNSAGVITRAIRMFKSETKTAPPAPKTNPRAEQQTSRIAEAVRPKGDGGHPPGKSEDDEFEAGYKSG